MEIYFRWFNHRVDKYIPSVRLKVLLPRKSLVLHNLDPISVGIKQKGHILHPAVRKPLLPVNIQAFKSRARRIQAIDRNTCSLLAHLNPTTSKTNAQILTDMSEALGLRVPIMILERLVALSPVIPRQLQQPLIISREPVLRNTLCPGVPQEIQVELRSRLFNGAE